MFTFSAQSALLGVVAFDVAGLLMGWQQFAHAAHLGGSLFGIWYAESGHALLWGRREKWAAAWEDIAE